MTMRKLSMLLWVVALAIGFGLTLRDFPPVPVAILVVVPSGGDAQIGRDDLMVALENEVGERGWAPELRVLSRDLSVPSDRDEVRRLGVSDSTRTVCAIIESDADDRPKRLVRIVHVRSLRETAIEAVEAAIGWTER